MEKKIFGMEPQQVRKAFYLMLSFSFIYLLATEPSLAVTIEGLQEPMKQLKKEIFGGWMMAVKIISAAVGLVFSVFRLSLLPFGLGAGISIGIHFIDKWLGEGADGALI